jgi:hypothetical protein
VSMPATAGNRLCVSSSRSVAVWAACPVGRPYTDQHKCGIVGNPEPPSDCEFHPPTVEVSFAVRSGRCSIHRRAPPHPVCNIDLGRVLGSAMADVNTFALAVFLNARIEYIPTRSSYVRGVQNATCV